MRSHRLLAFVLGLLCVLPVSAPELRGEEQDTAFEGFDRAPDPDEVGGPDADLYREGVALQQAGKYRSARKRFFRLIEEYPDSPYAAEAEDRSGPNAFLGFTCMHDPRPSERRIDVALMGDGYTLDRQDRFDKDAAGHLKVLLKEPTFAAYESYFNFWRFNLASQDTGVDEVEPVLPDDELEEHMKRRRKKRKVRTYETALDCKAAGPQGQVAANPRCVWHYLSYLDVNDALAVCFAKMGSLGMGGMGIATTGPKGRRRPRVRPRVRRAPRRVRQPPGTARRASPSRRTRRRIGRTRPGSTFSRSGIPGVGVFEGAATFQTGVWRPAHGCAMNTGGNEYCPVCREATVLMIYTYVSPIDVVRPDGTRDPPRRGRLARDRGRADAARPRTSSR